MAKMPDQRAPGTGRSAAVEPLMAAIGAGDLAARTLGDALRTARERVTRRADSARGELAGLSDRLEAGELRTRLDAARSSARDLYKYLAEHGQQTVGDLRTRPAVRRAVTTAESAVGEAREFADGVRNRVVRRDRTADTGSTAGTGSDVTIVTDGKTAGADRGSGGTTGERAGSRPTTTRRTTTPQGGTTPVKTTPTASGPARSPAPTKPGGRVTPGE